MNSHEPLKSPNSLARISTLYKSFSLQDNHWIQIAFSGYPLTYISCFSEKSAFKYITLSMISIPQGIKNTFLVNISFKIIYWHFILSLVYPNFCSSQDFLPCSLSSSRISFKVSVVVDFQIKSPYKILWEIFILLSHHVLKIRCLIIFMKSCTFKKNKVATISRDFIFF